MGDKCALGVHGSLLNNHTFKYTDGLGNLPFY